MNDGVKLGMLKVVSEDGKSTSEERLEFGGLGWASRPDEGSSDMGVEQSQLKSWYAKLLLQISAIDLI